RAIERKMLGELRKLESHKDIVWSVAVSPDGKTALSGGGDQRDGGTWKPGSDFDIRVWDLATGKELRRLKGHSAGVTCVTFSPDGKTAFSASGDNTVRQWDVASGKELRKFEGHSQRVLWVACSADGKRILSGGRDSTLRIWDVSNGKETAQLR